MPSRLNAGRTLGIQPSTVTFPDWRRIMRKSRLASVLLTVCAFAAPVIAGAEECRYSAPRNADIDAAGLRSLMLRLGSSDLDIRGAAGLNRIEVRGTACASNQAWLKDLQISTGRNGGQATVDAEHHTDTSIFNLFGDNYAVSEIAGARAAGVGGKNRQRFGRHAGERAGVTGCRLPDRAT